MTKRLKQWTMAICCLTLAASPALAAPPEGKGGGGGEKEPTATVTYQLTFLGTPPGMSSPYVSDMNNHGDIAGSCSDRNVDYGTSTYRAFLYTAADGFIDINSLPAMDAWPDWTAAEATGVNDNGQMSVTMIHLDGTMAIFVYEPLDQSLTKLDIIGDFYADGRVQSSINALGYIAYNKYDASGTSWWHFYSEGSITPLGIIGVPNDINLFGEIAGTSGGDVVRYSPSTDPLLLSGSSYPRINDLGDMSLTVETKGNKIKPARYVEATGTTETVHDSWKTGDINSASDVCFWDGNANVFVSQPESGTFSVEISGSATDLEKWSYRTMKSLYMIDRDQTTGFGQISGTVITNSGGKEVFLLTPVAPAS